MSNKPFPDKKGEAGSDKPGYANSLLVQEKDLAAVAEWTPHAIQDRRDRLVEWALVRWAINEDVPIIEVDEEEDEPEGLETVVAESLEELEDQFEPREEVGSRRQNRPPRGLDWWKWYVDEPKHSVALIEIVRRVVEGIQAAAPADWQVKPSRNQISLRVAGKKAVRVNFWGATVGLTIIGHKIEPEPNPFDLPGKVEKPGWSWQIARLEQVPTDMFPVVEIVEKQLAISRTG